MLMIRVTIEGEEHFRLSIANIFPLLETLLIIYWSQSYFFWFAKYWLKCFSAQKNNEITQ